MDTKPERQSFPMVSKGVVQNKEPGLLDAGELIQQDNWTATTDGALSVRFGTRFYFNTEPALAGAAQSIFKLSFGGAQSADRYYVQTGGNLTRVTALFTSYTTISTGIFFSSAKSEAIAYAQGTSGNPVEYIANATYMGRDDGSFSVLRPWGIPIPARPCSVALGSTVPPVAGDVLLGSPLVINANADGGTYSGNATGNVDWSFSGNVQFGYDSNDTISIDVTVSVVADVSALTLNIYVNGSATDYYTHSIIPPGTTGTTTYVFSKNSFNKVGNAGQGYTSWKTVTKAELVILSNVAGGGAFTVTINNIFGSAVKGPNSTATPVSVPYDYLYIFRNPTTGAIGNPCAPMLPVNYVDVTNQAVVVTFGGTDTAPVTGDPSLVGYGSVVIYRRGGSFADGLYRVVGYGTNPGAGSTSTFTDSQDDLSIAANDTLEYDNYPPVTSDLPIPFVGTLNSLSGSAPGFVTITPAGYVGATSDLTKFFTLGSTVFLGKGVNEEETRVAAVTTTTVTVYMQVTHATSEEIDCDAAVGTPCDIACKAGDSILLAGDSRNPHKVYRSKAGRPEAFPVINLENGNPHIVNISTPSNPIYGLVEYNGEYAALCRTRIFVFQIWIGGQFSLPQEMPGARGMVGKHLWCKGENYIWFLSSDGIYKWGGGEPVKVSRKVDYIFNNLGQIVNGMYPLDYSQLSQVAMEYYNNHLYVLFRNTNGTNTGMRYDISNDRWEFYYIGPHELNVIGGVLAVMTALFADNDVGALYGILDYGGQSYVMQAEVGNKDIVVLNGGSINSGIWSWFVTGWYGPGGRDINKLLTGITVEIEDPTDNLIVETYYDYDYDPLSPVPSESFTIIKAAGRRFFDLPLNQSSLGGGKSDSKGREFRVCALRIIGGSLDPNFGGGAFGKCVVYSITFNYIPLAPLNRGRITDWNDLNHKADKRLYAVGIEYDLKGNTGINLFLDIKGGIAGGVETDGVTTIALQPQARALQWFAIPDGIIAKMVRFRPQFDTTTVSYEIFDIQWHKEDYPEDVVLFSEYEDNGSPFLKYLQQVIFDVNTNGQNVTVQIQGDGVTLETIVVAASLSTRTFTYTVNSPLKATRFRYLVTTPLATGAIFQRWNVQWVTTPADMGPVAHTEDWKDEGTPNDKKLRVISVEYENGGGALVLQLDQLRGIGTGTEFNDIAEYTLNGTGTTRAKQQFPVSESVSAGKAFRLRPKVGQTLPGNFRIWSWKAKEFEEWPADTILHTPWSDFGYKHLKYVQEIAFMVDTGNVAAQVTIQSDGLGIQAFSITSTSDDRERTVTLNPVLIGKQFRLLISPGVGGKFQVWDWTPKFTKGDEGEVTHSTDYDPLSTPHPKKLLSVAFSYDNGGVPFSVAMDTIGANGVTVTLNEQIFLLNAAGRARQTFAFTNDSLVVAVRFHPTGGLNLPTLRMWSYEIDKVVFPAIFLPSTEWDNLGWACEKVARGLELTINTNGVPCSVQLQVDGANFGAPYSITTTDTDRTRILTVNPNALGKLFRLVFTPGAGGWSQVFDVKFDAWKEPCYRNYWNSGEIVLGAAGWHYLHQIHLEYMCAGSLTMTILRDSNQLFFQNALPSHSFRDSEKFFLPMLSASGLFLNKSRRYTFILESTDPTKPFKIYADASRVESRNLSEGARAALRQNLLWMGLSPQAGA